MELGFVEKADSSSLLTSPNFPSKVGGRPAWLDLSFLPAPEQLACRNCGKPTVFLLQLYAPLDYPHTYHRTLYVFVCREGSCHSQGSAKAFVVLQCQLGRENDFYDAEVSDEDSGNEEGARKACTGESSPTTVGREGHNTQQLSTVVSTSVVEQCSIHEAMAATSLSTDSKQAMYSSADSGAKSSAQEAESPQPNDDDLACFKCSKHLSPPVPPSLCIVCGCQAPKKCAKCKQVSYCSREHQIHDWKKGHKLNCSQLTQPPSASPGLPYDPADGILLPEFEIVREPEPESSEPQPKRERSEEERMEDYRKFISSSSYKEGKLGDGVGDSELKEIEKASSKGKSDKVFKVFQKRVAIEPEQVIRYGRGGEPLLVSAVNPPPSGEGIPRCSRCGTQRTFEFQVMPQLLYYLKLDSVSGAPSVDWGTLLVYTCATGCPLGAGYHGEFLWKQDITN